MILENKKGIERLERDYGEIKRRWDDLWNVKEKHDELERDYHQIVLIINQDRVYNI